MAIKFTCPHCRKALRVKDHLAGKKAQCPSCRKPLTVPAAAPQSKPVDLEAFAAAAFGDEPKATPAEQAAIVFKCYYCDEEVRVGADLAGKQTPCPECRRIIKVPFLEKKQPKDWRKMDGRLPAGARSDLPVPEGAWETGSVGVSRQALVEAQAIPQIRRRLTVGQWITRATAGIAGVLLIGGAVWMVVHSLAVSRQNRALAKALQYLEPAGKLSPEATAEIHRGAGVYYLRTSNRGCAVEARNHFQQARAAILQAANVDPVEREAFLIDLALAQVDLGGEKPEVDNLTRLPWEEANKELRQTWQNVASPDGRAEALRLVTRKLLTKNQGNFAPALATLFPDESSERLAIVGLEMFSAKQEPMAEMLANQASQNLAPQAQPQAGEAKPPAGQPAPSLIALWLALGKPEKAVAASPAPEAGKGSAVLIGNVKGLVYQGKLDQARDRIRSATAPEDRFLAWIALATAADDNGQANAARPELEDALNLLEGEWKNRPVPPWQLLRLARVGVKAGLEERVQAAARLIGDAAARGRMQLEVLRGRLAANKDRTDESWIQIVDANTPAHIRALELLARHSARLGTGTAMQKTAESGEEKLQPFAYLGVALGLQDREL